MAQVACKQCALPYPEDGTPFRCPRCGGLFDEAQPLVFDPRQVDSSRSDQWRYQAFFGLEPGSPRVTLGEGNTPLVAGQAAGREVFYKLESQNPTGSYKDRGTAVLVSQLAGRGVRRAVEDSSGNAGASFAAYAARAGVQARVFVPQSASGPKLNQIRDYGAELVAVPGPRSQAAQAVLSEAEQGIPYASHAFLPFGLPGIATIAYELWEALGQAPGTVIAPAGHGALLLGIIRGFLALQAAGLIEGMPYMVGVQAAACAPLYAAQTSGPQAADQVEEGTTLAEGVRVRHPARAADLLGYFAGGKRGQFVAVDEAGIRAGFKALAGQGIYAEPTSALAWAALQVPEIETRLSEPIVLIISGSGLKSSYHIE